VRISTGALCDFRPSVATSVACPNTLRRLLSIDVEAFVNHPASEEYVGKEVRVPDQIFKELVGGVPASCPDFHPEDRNNLISICQAVNRALTPEIRSGERSLRADSFSFANAYAFSFSNAAPPTTL